jgi:hypothetical protein
MMHTPQCTPRAQRIAQLLLLLLSAPPGDTSLRSSAAVRVLGDPSFVPHPADFEPAPTPARELSAELGVSVRTIDRDLELLRSAG